MRSRLSRLKVFTGIQSRSTILVVALPLREPGQDLPLAMIELGDRTLQLLSVTCGTDPGAEAAAFDLLNEVVHGHF